MKNYSYLYVCVQYTTVLVLAENICYELYEKKIGSLKITLKWIHIGPYMLLMQEKKSDLY